MEDGGGMEVIRIQLQADSAEGLLAQGATRSSNCVLRAYLNGEQLLAQGSDGKVEWETAVKWKTCSPQWRQDVILEPACPVWLEDAVLRLEVSHRHHAPEEEDIVLGCVDIHDIQLDQPSKDFLLGPRPECLESDENLARGRPRGTLRVGWFLEAREADAANEETSGFPGPALSPPEDEEDEAEDVREWEKRWDSDGELYDKSEFRDCYGDGWKCHWDIRAREDEELRYDTYNQIWCGRTHFISVREEDGEAAWEAAEEVARDETGAWLTEAEFVPLWGQDNWYSAHRHPAARRRAPPPAPP
eukprot:Hpha_TRINITY_DN26844_c0_g1::TRINITY_DN26844_c0_g1_i1::g.17184::m.17184